VTDDIKFSIKGAFLQALEDLLGVFYTTINMARGGKRDETS